MERRKARTSSSKQQHKCGGNAQDKPLDLTVSKPKDTYTFQATDLSLENPQQSIQCLSQEILNFLYSQKDRPLETGHLKQLETFKRSAQDIRDNPNPNPNPLVFQ